MTESTADKLHGVTFVEGRATYRSRPPAPSVLEVTTTWRCPTPGYELKLEVAPPPTVPPAIALRLLVTPPTGGVPDVLTDVPVHYLQKTDQEYKEVLIHPDGPTLPVERLG